MNDQVAALPTQDATADWHPFIPMPVEAARAAQAKIRAKCAVAEVLPNLHYVFAAKEAKKTLLDHRNFSNVGNFGADAHMPPFVTLLDPPEHSEVRNLLNQGFTRTSIVEADGWIGDIVASLIDGFVERGEADIVTDLSFPLTERVITRLVGIPPEDSAMLARWSLAITAMLPRPRFDTEEWQRIETYIDALLERRRQAGEQPDDMIARLMSGRIGGKPLTTREITGHIWLLFVGGLETTAYSLSILIHELLADREQWERLVNDRSLLANAIEEGLRYTSPFRAIERQITADVSLGGCPAHAGQLVFVGLESANLDESVFGADASTFKHDRPEANRHVAFGFGRHTCLGAALARTEISTALSQLLDRLPGLKLAPGFRLETSPSQFSHIPKRVDVVW